MKYAGLVIAVYLAAVVDVALGDLVCIGAVGPDLLALVALVWVLTGRRAWGFAAAGGVGLLSDLLGPGRLGPGLGWMLLVAYALQCLRETGRFESVPARITLVGVGTALWSALVGLSQAACGDVTLSATSILGRALGVGLFTAAVSLPVWMILGWRADGLAGDEQAVGEN